MAEVYKSISGKEYSKFVESPSRTGQSAVETVSNSTNPFSPPPGSLGFTVVEGVTDRTYQFRDAYPAGTILKTVIVYYSNASKTDITGAEIT